MSFGSLSFVTSTYNDHHYIDDFCRSAREVVEQLSSRYKKKIPFEVIVVDDGSIRDYADLDKCLREHSELKYVKLSRNFGQHNAIVCGIEMSDGDLVIRNNIDLQDSLEYVPGLIDTLYASGADLAIGKYQKRKSPFLNKVTALIFFSVISWLTGQKFEQNTSPLRVMTRKFARILSSIPDSKKFIQGLENWVGFKTVYMSIEHKSVDGKVSSYTMAKRLNLALDILIRYSERPLILMFLLGAIVASVFFVFSIYSIILYSAGSSLASGYLSIFLAVVAFGGLNLSAITLVGLLLSNMRDDILKRPAYIIDKVISGGEL